MVEPTNSRSDKNRSRLVLIDQAGLAAAEQALGGVAIESLRRRRLLEGVDVAAGAVSADRLAGALVGLALGDALAGWARRAGGRPLTADAVRHHLGERSGRPQTVSALTQSLVLSAEAWLADGWRAPGTVAAELDRRLATMRSPGAAVRHAVEQRRTGAPWFEAAGRSFGSAALPRAVAVGAVQALEPRSVGLAASLDSAVSHASRRAAASAAALAGIVAALVARPANADVWSVVRRVVEALDHGPVRALLLGALDNPSADRWDDDVPPHAPDVLAAALRFTSGVTDPAGALVRAVLNGGGDRTVVAVAGAIVGAVHGLAALPVGWNDVEGAPAYQELARRIATRTSTGGGSPVASAVGADIWFLLDRSGSMRITARDVVAGFDRFFTGQREVVGDATVTVVQFDDEEPHDVIVDARPIADVPSIRGRFEPRGCTPLYDAIGLLIDRAERHGGDDAEQLVVIMTDGLENASRRWDQQSLFDRIRALRDRGWTFVFLGANQDSYAAGASFSMHDGNVSNFSATPASVSATYDGLTRTVSEWRRKDHAARRRDRDHFWGGVKEGEDVAD
jgi:ADP-ribosylglycohydrolase